MVKSDSVFSFLFKTTLETLRQLLTFRLRRREILSQVYVSMVESFPVISFSMVVISMMLVLEFSYHMKLVLRQDTLVPAFSTLLIVRELSPVVTSLLLSSRIGASMTAELSTMKMTDQIDALKLFNIDPIDALVIPRLIGSVVAAVVLNFMSIIIALLSGGFIASVKLNTNIYQYFNAMLTFTDPYDFYTSLVKSFAFGCMIAGVACYQGLRPVKNAQGVGEATTRSVVHSSVTIILSDFFLTYSFYAV